MNKFKWPKEKKLEIKLKDMLEQNVDSKYYLSEEKLEKIRNWNAQQKPLENMVKNHNSGVSSTITTREADEQSGMKLIVEKIKKEQIFGTFAQENVVSSKQNETIPTLTATGAFSRHKIIENVFKSGHHSGKIHNPEEIAPTFKENHGNGIFIKESTKKGFKEVFVKLNGKTTGQIGTIENNGKYDMAKRIYDGYHPTITTNEPIQWIKNQLRIRKITPREALRLMGVDDKRIDLIQDSNLIEHNKQYFIAGNSIVVQVLESIFKNIDFPKDRPLKVFETFAGYGSQAIALKNLGYKLETHTSEWFVDAIIAYALVHHNKEFYINKKYMEDNNYTKLMLLEELEKWTLSTDSKKPNDLKRVSQEKLLALLSANEVNHNKGSILDIKGDMLDQYDLLTYSFPCQDLSLAGKRAGMSKDSKTRSGLLWEIERIILELKELDKLPKVLLMENVPQIHSKDNIDDFNKWIQTLSELGYKSTYKDLNAKNFGIPQNRNRTFMVSILDGEVENEVIQQLTLF